MYREIEDKREMINQWGTPLLTSKTYPNLTHKAYKTILMPKFNFSLNVTILTTGKLPFLQKLGKYQVHTQTKFQLQISRSYNTRFLQKWRL